MDYNLQKLITPSLPIKASQAYLRQDQAIDYVNPGLGNVSRLYSFYIPLPKLPENDNITKVDQKTTSQEGFGNLDENQTMSTDSLLIEPDRAQSLDQNPGPGPSTSKYFRAENKVQSNSEIDNAIRESFQHPKIRVSEKTFHKLTQKNESTISPKVTEKVNRKRKNTEDHKFQFID